SQPRGGRRGGGGAARRLRRARRRAPHPASHAHPLDRPVVRRPRDAGARQQPGARRSRPLRARRRRRRRAGDRLRAERRAAPGATHPRRRRRGAGRVVRALRPRRRLRGGPRPGAAGDRAHRAVPRQLHRGRGRAGRVPLRGAEPQRRHGGLRGLPLRRAGRRHRGAQRHAGGGRRLRDRHGGRGRHRDRLRHRLVAGAGGRARPRHATLRRARRHRHRRLPPPPRRRGGRAVRGRQPHRRGGGGRAARGVRAGLRRAGRERLLLLLAYRDGGAARRLGGHLTVLPGMGRYTRPMPHPAPWPVRLALLLALLLGVAHAEVCRQELTLALPDPVLERAPTGIDAARALKRAVDLVEPALPPLSHGAAVPLPEDDPDYGVVKYLVDRRLLPETWRPDGLDGATWGAMLSGFLGWYELPRVSPGPPTTVDELVADMGAVLARVADAIRPAALLATDPADGDRTTFWAIIWNWTIYPRLLVVRPSGDATAQPRDVLPRLLNCAVKIVGH